MCAVSQDPANYRDAPTEGIRRILESVTGDKIPRGEILPTTKIGVS
jgi:5-oxoprolinase (ATP-hydrolysing)